MSRWIGGITDVGDDLIFQTLGENKVTVCTATFGTGTVDPDVIKEQMSLVAEKQTASIIENKKVSNGRRIGVQVRGHTEEYTCNQIAFWGRAGDTGPLVLVALYQYEAGVQIPSASDTPDFLYTFYGVVSVKNDADIDVIIDQSTNVSREIVQRLFEEHNADLSAHEIRRRVIATRTRDPSKPTYGLVDDEDTIIALDVGPYTGQTEVGVVVSDTEYDANNLSQQGEAAANGTLIFKKVEV